MALCTITLEELLDYIDGRASAVTAERVEQHRRSGCRSCRERLASLREQVDALQDTLAEADIAPSAAAREYGRSLSRLRTAPEPAPAAPLFGDVVPAIRRWIAELVPPQGLVPAGARFAGGPAPAQQLFETPEHLVTLWEDPLPEASGSYVICQVYSRSDQHCVVPESVLFTAASTGAAHVAEREDNEFHASDLSPDTYLVQCWLSDTEVLTLRRVRIGRS